ncbi:hypothetical protein [Asanoa siamensis]|uniref:Uncharacterized protein n=1 Tax=Asanoa siamensis TaxID=926357 RepID=A0ABQ4CKW0_9ACTN|nr:hypothetical protein [Asanoa siamensis]GIF71916.1 hypothetical protein Asi02nite_14340 [Asanoa siamensis]
MDPNHGVQITVKDVYDQVLGMRSTVDVMLHRQTDAEARGVDHEARLRSLERGRWPLHTVSVLLALAAAAIALVGLLTR